MKTVYTKCYQMLPSPTDSKLERMRNTITAWKIRNKVESRIRELRNRVNKCYTRFMVSMCLIQIYPYNFKQFHRLDVHYDED